MARWSLYMIRCRGGTIYTGIATDVARRIAEHRGNRGRGAKYLRSRGPLQLVLHRAIGSRSLALKLERRIKRLPKKRKEALIGQSSLIDQMVKQIRRDLPASSRPTRPLSRRRGGSGGIDCSGMPG